MINIDGTEIRRLSDEPFAFFPGVGAGWAGDTPGKLAAYHSVYTVDLGRGETAPRSQAKGVYFHDTTWSSTPT